MDSKRESALVGFFVIVAAALLIATFSILSGAFTSGDVPFHAYFKNAGGLQPGTEVRYAGGPPVGRVTKVHFDPQDPTRMKIDFAVHPDLPIKTDSVVIITSNSALGDNFLGIRAGTLAAPRAQKDATLKSEEYTSIGDVTAMLAALGPTAQDLLHNLNDRVLSLRETLERVNDLLNDENRRNIAASLANVRGMLEEDRPAIHSTLNNINASSAKLGPLIDDFKKTAAQANDAITHIDAMIAEDRPDLKASLASLRQVLASATSITDQLDRTLNANSENLDEIIENMKYISENMKEFTDTIKTRPYTLIRSSTPKQHEPGQPQH
jgi:phospholipid/cholesterol/gamma-HCH transport system substrate-binding protein